MARKLKIMENEPKATGEPVGCCGIVFSNNVDKAAKGLNEAEKGYWIGKSYWGKGMIPEAVRVHVHSCSATETNACARFRKCYDFR